MTAAETDLWHRWKTRRDRDAFQRLVAAHEAFVHDFARRICGHDADAEDVAQEAFLELAEAPLDRPLQVGLRAFLGRRIVLAAKTLKRAALSRRLKEAQAPLPAAPPAGTRPETEEALALLDDEERQAVVLRFLHGLSYAEVAEVLGISEGAARVRVHRALHRLRARLGPGAERAIAALPLFLPATTFSHAAAAAAIEGGAVLVTVSSNKLLVVAVVFLLLAGGIVATRLLPQTEPARAVARAPTEPATGPGGGDAEAAPTGRGEGNGGSAPASATGNSASASGEQPSAVSPAGTASLVGRIRFTDGSPVRDMLVGPGVEGLKDVRTDEEGRFAFESPLYPPFDLCELGPDGFKLAIAAVPAGTKEIEIALDRGFALEGSVEIEGTGKRVPDALLELKRPGASATDSAQAKWGKAQTDAEGRFGFEHLPAATYEITLTARGIEPLKVSVDIREGSLPLQLLVRPARDMTVRFADLPDHMLGHKVTLGVWELGDAPLRLWYWDVEIDPKGEVHVEAPPPGRYGIRIFAPRGEVDTGMGYRDAKFESVAGEAVLVVLESPPGARVEGTLLLPDGSPAAKRLVQLERSQLRADTDGVGRFVFDDAHPGEEMLVLREGMTDLRIAKLEVPAQGVLRRDVRLTGTGSVTGRFTSAAGEANPLLALRRKSDGEFVARVFFFTGGGDGTFRIPYLDPGDYVLVAGVLRKGSLARDVTVANDEVDVGDLAIEQTPEVPVVCTVPAGVRIAGEIRVQAKNAGGEASGWLALDDVGRGYLRGLPPGRYRLSFTAPGCAPLEVDVEVEKAPSRPLVFALLPK